MSELSFVVSLLNCFFLVLFGRHAMRARDKANELQRMMTAVENANRIANESLAASTEDIKELHIQFHKMQEEIHPLKKRILGVDEKLKNELLAEIEVRNGQNDLVVMSKEIAKLRCSLNQVDEENRVLNTSLTSANKKLEKLRAINRRKNQELRKLKASSRTPSKKCSSNTLPKAISHTSSEQSKSLKTAVQEPKRLIKVGGVPHNG